jgi:C-terminal processing protease CtpA/Prc
MAVVRRPSSRILLFVVAGALFALLASVIWSSAAEPDDAGEKRLPPKTMHELLDKIQKTVEDVHVNPYYRMKKEDYHALAKRLHEQCDQPMTMADFYLLATQLVKPVGDVHDSLRYHGRDKYLPLSFVWAADGIGIVDAAEGYAELRNSRVETIAGVDAEGILKNYLDVYAAENAESARHFALELLPTRFYLRFLTRQPLGDVVEIKVQKDGQTRTAPVAFSGLRRMPNPPAVPNFWKTIPEIHTGYFRLAKCELDDDYRHSVQNFFYRLSQEEMTRMVVDVRGDPGGKMDVFQEFFNKMPGYRFKNFTTQMRVSDQAKEQRHLLRRNYHFVEGSDVTTPTEDVWRKPGSEAGVSSFKGRVFFLVDKGSMSAATDLPTLYKDNEIGVVVGEKTGNAPTHYGDLLHFKLGHGLTLRVSFCTRVRPRPKSDPEDGLNPDVKVPRLLSDYFAGRDPQLEWIVAAAVKEEKKTDDPALVAQVMKKHFYEPYGAAVVSSAPRSGDEAVDPATTRLRVVFDKPMSFECRTFPSHAGKMPVIVGKPRWVDAKTWEAVVKLEPGKVYALWLNRVGDNGFHAETGEPARPFHLIFRTKKAPGPEREKKDQPGAVPDVDDKE